MGNSRRRMLMTLSLACAAAVGCEVGPNYKPPVVNVAPTFAEIPPTTRPSTLSDVNTLDWLST